MKINLLKWQIKALAKGYGYGKMYISNKKRENSSLFFVDKQRNVWYNKA
jgi:hypothetical protein